MIYFRLKELVIYPSKCEIFVCLWMTLSTYFFVSTLGDSGSKSSDLSHSELRSISSKFHCIVLVNLHLFLQSVLSKLENSISRRDKTFLAELMRQASWSFAFPLSIMNYSLSISLFPLVSKAFIYMCLGKISYYFLL